MSEFTTLVVRGLGNHPRRLIIDGIGYDVACSSDGHIPAQIEELEQFVNCARAGDLDGMTAQEIRSHAQTVKDLSGNMRMMGHGE